MDFIKEHTRLVTTIIVIILVVIGLIVIKTTRRDKKTEQQKINDSVKTLAMKYYEEQYYPSIAESEEDKKSFLNDFRLNGIKFRLKNLLKYKEEVKYEDYVEYKNSRTNQECDQETSYFIIKPHEPYGVKDYDIEVYVDCGF